MKHFSVLFSLTLLTAVLPLNFKVASMEGSTSSLSSSSTVDKWDGEGYKHNSTPQYVDAVNALSEYNFTGNESVLDIGCGNGHITANEIAKRVPNGRVVGFDYSSSMVAQAQRDFPTSSNPNLSFRVLDAAELDAQADLEGQFDLVVSFVALHWVPNQQRALNGIFKALKPGGKLIMTMLGGRFPYVPQVVAMEKWSENFPTGQEYYNYKNAEQFKEMLEISGFTGIATSVQLHPRFFNTKEALSNWLITMVPSFTGLKNQKEIEEFTADAANLFEENNRDWKTPILHASATKPS